MAKVIELVVITFIIAMVGAGSFEIIKRWFLKQKPLWKTLILIGGLVIAVGLTLLIQIAPEPQEIHIKVPIPQFSSDPLKVKQITLTAKAPILPSIVFGLLVAFLAILDTIRLITRTTPPSIDNPPKPLYARFAQSPLFLYPALALGYKTFLLDQIGPNFWTGYVISFSALSAPIYALIDKEVFSTARIVGVAVLGLVLASVIAIAAIF